MLRIWKDFWWTNKKIEKLAQFYNQQSRTQLKDTYHSLTNQSTKMVD